MIRQKLRQDRVCRCCGVTALQLGVYDGQQKTAVVALIFNSLFYPQQGILY